jgi:hypothetical protein
MDRKMFGHRNKKKSLSYKVPGEPYGYEQNAYGNTKDNPSSYEGKEHVKYEDPGYSSHHIKYPDDEPHMKSHVSQNEEHEMEDNYHMDVPDQTAHGLESKIKRARMKMDAPDQEDPDYLRGNITHQVGSEGEEDTSGEEEEGPNMMQKGSKDDRKKMIVSVMKRKMKKHHS